VVLRDSAFGEMQLIVALRGIERAVAGVDEVAKVGSVGSGVAIQTELGSDEAVEIVVLEKFARAEEVGALDLVGVDLLHHHVDVGLGVGDAVGDGLLHLWRKLDRLKLSSEPRLSLAKRAMRPVSEGSVGRTGAGS